MPLAADSCRALVVDDEEGAARALERLLVRYAGVEVVGRATSVAEARRMIRETGPDIVFLDVEMPRTDGLTLCADISPSMRVVLVTAYDDYAVEAFEAGARDYLLKPVTAERLSRCLERLLGDTAVPATTTTAGSDRLVEGARLACDDGHTTVLVPVGEIVWIEAREPGSEVHSSDGRSTPARRSLTAWEQELPPDRFVRVDRSLIVALDWVERISWRSQGGTRLGFSGLTISLTLGRAATTRLKQVLGERTRATPPPER